MNNLLYLPHFSNRKKNPPRTIFIGVLLNGITSYVPSVEYSTAKPSYKKKILILVTF